MDYLSASDNQTFIISGFDGDVGVEDTRGLGLYYHDMRFLSGLELRIGGNRLSVLSCNDDDAYRATVLLASDELTDSEGNVVPARSVCVNRARAVSGAVYERLTVTSYGRSPVSFELSLELAADFLDMFLVRGYVSGVELGHLAEPRREGDGAVLAYEGADGVRRELRIGWSVEPDDVRFGVIRETGGRAEQSAVTAAWRLSLEPQESRQLELRYVPSDGSALETPPDFSSALALVRGSYDEWAAHHTQVASDNPDLVQLLRRSALDLRALRGVFSSGSDGLTLSALRGQSYPSSGRAGRVRPSSVILAGIPWYAVPFGRDSIITGLQTLCLEPELAAGTLRFLVAHQGVKEDPARAEEPGKIMHELRFGELARLGAIPHTPYYGTADATPLFVMLFAQTMLWTGDLQMYRALMPAVRRAVEWIERYGDSDGDGYVEYAGQGTRGALSNQGWKDSWDSLLYPDGSVPKPPIALVEVQAYCYAARTWLAAVARRMGDGDYADELEARAGDLRERFNRDFWMEDEGYYCQALDGSKAQVRDLVSNPGHALLCGIVPEERVGRLAEKLTSDAMLSGWGVRTRGSTDPNYSPTSYHNGTVWPHDNSLIVAGLARSGRWEEANRISEQLLAAARWYRMHRLPELMCGFTPEETGGGPAGYPVSCIPQAWAAGSAWLMLQSILGLEPNALERRLRVCPRPPEWLGEVALHNLRVGDARLELRVTRSGVDVIEDGGITVEVC